MNQYWILKNPFPGRGSCMLLKMRLNNSPLFVLLQYGFLNLTAGIIGFEREYKNKSTGKWLELYKSPDGLSVMIQITGVEKNVDLLSEEMINMEAIRDFHKTRYYYREITRTDT